MNIDAPASGALTLCLRPDKAPDLTLVARLPADAPPEPGTILRLSADTADLRAYPAEQP